MENPNPPHQDGMKYGEKDSGKFIKQSINPRNQESYPNQNPSIGQPFPLSTARQVRFKLKS